MSYIYLKVTKLPFSKLKISKFKSLFLGQYIWGASIHAGIAEFSNFFLQPKNQRSGSKTVAFLSFLF